MLSCVPWERARMSASLSGSPPKPLGFHRFCPSFSPGGMDTTRLSANAEAGVVAELRGRQVAVPSWGRLLPRCAKTMFRARLSHVVPWRSCKLEGAAASIHTADMLLETQDLHKKWIDKADGIDCEVAPPNPRPRIRDGASGRPTCSMLPTVRPLESTLL